MTSSKVERGLEENSAGRAAALRLGAYSFLILFFELALIRYLPAHVKVFSYYINFVLIAAFVGMGAGLIAARESERLRWALPILAVLLFGLAKWFSNILVQAPRDPDEYLWAVFFETSPTVSEIGLVPTVALIFAACALFFVPLGALVGEEFRRFRPLVAYSIDIGGSLTGIVFFGLISYLGWPPWAWFALGFAVLTAASLHRPLYAGVIAVIAPPAIVLLVAGVAQPDERWSPYYRIDWYRASDAHFTINVNASMHLTAVDFSEPARRTHPWVRELWEMYRTPYRLVERVDTVLVMGAGAGNDVALLLDMGAQHIDAVEIDPQIIELGRELHPRQPYADPRVDVHVTDARAFLRETRNRYDLLVFGTLDSQTLLSGMSSVRLDNYVYTVEALRAAKKVLAPGGTLIMYHMSHRPYIAAKIFRLLATTFDEPPQVFYWERQLLFNYAFVAGGWRREGSREAQYPPELLQDVSVPTDSWPYLYLARPILPLHYVKGLAVVLVFSALLVLAAGGRELRGGADVQMFLLGFGFLLLETKSVTEMSLLFGSTWQVNLLVFSSILLVILLANWLVLTRREIRLRRVLSGLLISLAVAYAVPVRALSSGSVWMEWLVAGALVALPIFFAGLVFAKLFTDRGHPVRSLGYNLFGAAVGGVAEYSVMVLGVKGLYLLAAFAYVLVWLSTERPWALTSRAAG